MVYLFPNLEKVVLYRSDCCVGCASWLWQAGWSFSGYMQCLVCHLARRSRFQAGQLLCTCVVAPYCLSMSRTELGQDSLICMHFLALWSRQGSPVCVVPLVALLPELGLSEAALCACATAPCFTCWISFGVEGPCPPMLWDPPVPALVSSGRGGWGRNTVALQVSQAPG